MTDEFKELELRYIIADNLLTHRVKRGMNLKEFADFLGVSKSTYYKNENGFFTPKVHALANIAKVLDVEITDLMKDNRVKVNA